MGEELSLRLQSNEWKVITTSCRRGRLARLVDMLSTALFQAKHYQVAVIEVYSGAAFVWAEAVCKLLQRLGKPRILVLHGGGLPAFAKDKIKRVTGLFLSASKVITPSRWISESFSAYYPNIEVIPNAIEVSDYSFRLRSSSASRIFWLRAFHEIYQPWLAIEAFAEITSEFPGIELCMVGVDKGDGSLEKTREVIFRYNLDEKVSIVEGIPKKDVPLWLNGGDVFINTTQFESFGVSVMEAAACGLPIVSTNVGELPFIWDDEKDALLVPPGDPEAIAHAIRRILTEPGLAERLSSNARKKAERFDWKNILPQWESLLNELR